MMHMFWLFHGVNPLADQEDCKISRYKLEKFLQGVRESSTKSPVWGVPQQEISHI